MVDDEGRSGDATPTDDSHIRTSGRDATVRVWALDLDDLIEIAQEQKTRGLSDDECRQYLHLRDGCS